MIKKAIIKPHQIKRRSRYPRKDEHKVELSTFLGYDKVDGK